MNSVLKKQISDFIDTHAAIEKTWLRYLSESNRHVYNFNSIKVKNIDIDIRKCIYDYCLHVSKMAAYINIIFAKDGIDRTRVKEILSVDDKIRRYKEDSKKNYGSVIIHKALNDLYGARVILDYNFDFDELAEEIRKDFTNTYTTNACNDRGYKAVHVYVKCQIGHFRWELQIWNKKDEKTNIKLHEEYKREYIRELKEIGGENNVHS